MVHDAEAQRIEGPDLLRRKQNLERLGPPDDPREPCGASVARHPREVDLGMGEHRGLVRDADVAGEGELGPRAPGRPGDRRDRGSRQVFERPKCVLSPGDPLLSLLRGQLRPLFHVNAGREDAAPVPRHDDRADRVVLLEIRDFGRDFGDHGEGQRVSGRVLDPQSGEASFCLDSNVTGWRQHAARDLGPDNRCADAPGSTRFSRPRTISPQ